jgi:hypothetical protein
VKANKQTWYALKSDGEFVLGWGIRQSKPDFPNWGEWVEETHVDGRMRGMVGEAIAAAIRAKGNG